LALDSKGSVFSWGNGNNLNQKISQNVITTLYCFLGEGGLLGHGDE